MRAHVREPHRDEPWTKHGPAIVSRGVRAEGFPEREREKKSKGERGGGLGRERGRDRERGREIWRGGGVAAPGNTRSTS